MAFADMKDKKVAGVPVLYLGAGFVAILAVLAYRMKSTVTPGDPALATTADTAGGDTSAPAGDLYPGATTGTVVVAPQSNAPADAPYEDNQTWMRKAVAFLIQHGATPGEAQQALQVYLSGGDMTYAQGQLRDQAVREYGLPPDIGDVGNTGAKPPAPSTPVPPPVIVSKPPVIVRPPAKPPVKIPTAHHLPFPGRNVGPGSTGSAVVTVQHVVKVTADGKYGTNTAAHVKMWQRSHGLPQTGIVDARTWNRMV